MIPIPEAPQFFARGRFPEAYDSIPARRSQQRAGGRESQLNNLIAMPETNGPHPRQGTGRQGIAMTIAGRPLRRVWAGLLGSLSYGYSWLRLLCLGLSAG